MSIDWISRSMRTKPIADLLGEETMPGALVKGDAELKAYLRNHSQQVAHHFVGTCRMGTEAGTVVSPELRGRRRLDHAATHQRQHQCRVHDDRQEAGSASQQI
jgi:choline dehydrogenase-like flavoprotein